MRAERRLAAVAALTAAALGAAGCGDEPDPVRIGVVVDCQGAFRALQGTELSGAQLPLIVRGAPRKGRSPTDGIGPATVAGRRVELRPACSESGEFAAMAAAVRRLVEAEHAQAVVVGGPFTVDGIVLNQIARRYPRVAFMAGANGPREVTLARPGPNVFRVAADYGQGVAGLATHAYRDLGWRRVALMVEPWVAGWGAETAFVREFCALGGRVASRATLDDFPTKAADVPAVPTNVDGVAVLTSPLFLTGDGLGRLAAETGAPARRMVIGPDLAGDRDVLRAAGAALDGVTGAAYAPPPPSSAAVRRYLRDYAAAFPGASRSEPGTPLVAGYRNAVEAVIQAVAAARRRGTSLPAELGRLRTRLLGVPVRMDGHGQAVVSSTLVRIARAGRPSGPALRAVRTVPGVGQSVGGLVPAAYVPTGAGQACRRAAPPPWAR